MLTLPRRTKSVVAVVIAAVIGASSSIGAFAQTGPSLLSGDSSVVGSGGFATANVSYATAWVSGPAKQPRTFTASSPTTAAAAAVGSSASASTTPATQAPSSPSTGQQPTGGLPPIQLPTLPPIQLPGLPPIQLPNLPSVQIPDLTGSSVPTVQTATVTDALDDALDRIRQLGIDVPDLPDVALPPVTGLEVKAALLLLLTTIQTQTTATVAAARTATLAALGTSEFAGPIGTVFDQSTTLATAAFDQARAAVLAMDPAQLNNMPGEVIPMLGAAQLTIITKLTQATTTLLALAEQFA